MDKEMYTGMSDLQLASPTIDRGIALQKVPFLLKYLVKFGYIWFLNVLHPP